MAGAIGPRRRGRRRLPYPDWRPDHRRPARSERRELKNDVHVKTLKSLKTTSLESYYQGFILTDLNKSGFLHLHQDCLTV
jgi:hypothetical protein